MIEFTDIFISSTEFKNLINYGFLNTLNSFIYGSSRLGIKLLLIYFLISSLFYFFSNTFSKKFNIKNIFKFVFPVNIYSHPSTKMDFKIFFIRSMFDPAKIITFSVIVTLFSGIISQKLGVLFHSPFGKIQSNPISLTVISLIGFLLFDFTQYLVHRIFHKTSLLWPFHSPHHSAEVLNPFTVQREHFVWAIIEKFLLCFLFGIGHGILIWGSLGSVNPDQIFEYTLIFNIFNYIVGNFHHSHFWISFGFFDRIFISPAMHQLHHSVDARHRNKNYGYFLSIWDQMFGTIYVPKEKEKLIYGIEKGVKNPHDTLLKFYFLPFKESALVLKNKFQSLIQKITPATTTSQKSKPLVNAKGYKKEKSGSFQQAYKLK